MLIIVIVTTLLFILFISPSWLIWRVAGHYLPTHLSMPANKMEGLCILLSLITLFIINPALESGMLSLAIVLAVFTLAWTILLLPSCIAFKYFKHPRNT